MRYAHKKRKDAAFFAAKGACLMESTSNRIREIMKEQHISQKRLAVNLQVSNSSLNNYLSGRRWMSLNLIREVCRYLNISSDYLLGLSPQKHPSVLPEDEQELLEIYRTLPSHARRCATNQMKQLAQLCRLWERQQ